MIAIKKGREPSKLLEYRRQEFASYAGMPADIKQDVIRHLLSEQGYICAYCMKRIETGYGKHRATIEHLIPQAISTEAQRLNYHNMERDLSREDSISVTAKNQGYILNVLHFHVGFDILSAQWLVHANHCDLITRVMGDVYELDAHHPGRARHGGLF